MTHFFRQVTSELTDFSGNSGQFRGSGVGEFIYPDPWLFFQLHHANDINNDMILKMAII